jgi:hypothetical protein
MMMSSFADVIDSFREKERERKERERERERVMAVGRSVNQLWLRYVHPFILVFSAAVNVNVFSGCFLLSFFLLLLFFPSRFLPTHIRIATVNCLFTTIVAIVWLLGLFIVSILSWTDVVDICDGDFGWVAPLLGWAPLGKMSVKSSLWESLPPSVVFFSSIYMFATLYKGLSSTFWIIFSFVDSFNTLFEFFVSFAHFDLIIERLSLSLLFFAFTNISIPSNSRSSCLYLLFTDTPSHILDHTR